MSNNGSQLLNLCNHSPRPSQTVVFHVFPTFPYLNGLRVSQDKNVQHVHIWVLLEDVGLGVVLEVAVVPPVCRGTLGKEIKFSSTESCSQAGITPSFIGSKGTKVPFGPDCGQNGIYFGKSSKQGVVELLVAMRLLLPEGS